jgi:hypothetical protein
MGDRHTNFEDPMVFLNALYIFVILNSLIPLFFETPCMFSIMKSIKKNNTQKTNKSKLGYILSKLLAEVTQ